MSFLQTTLQNILGFFLVKKKIKRAFHFLKAQNYGGKIFQYLYYHDMFGWWR